MGTASLVLGVGIGMLHLLLRTDRLSTASAEQQRTISRLSRVFREDAHAARDAALAEANGDEGFRLDLQLQGAARVEYRTSDRRLLRVLREGDEIRHRDVFPFAAEALVEADVEDGPRAVVLRLSLPRAVQLAGTGTAGTGQPATVFRLRATVGRDRRWEGDTP